MAYIVNKTRFRSSSYGIGVFRGYELNKSVIVIAFENHGTIKFAATAVGGASLRVLADDSPQPTPKPNPSVKTTSAPKTSSKPKITGEGTVKNTTAQETHDDKHAKKSISNNSTPKSISECILYNIIGDPNIQPPAVSSVAAPGDSIVQYDTSATVIGDKNIIEAFNCDDVAIFNESYVIVGNETHAHKIIATYDLTVIGSLSVDEVHVNGNLTIIGNLDATKVCCFSSLLCHGDISATDIYIGKDIVADSVKCAEFSCYGNAIIRGTIDIDKSSRTRKTMVACEGILGAGVFVAVNAIANDYFEFDGEIQGRILELDAEKVIKDLELVASADDTSLEVPSAEDDDSLELSFEEELERISERFNDEFERVSALSEQDVLELTTLVTTSAISELANIDTLFRYLAKLSKQNNIDDLGDYLLIAFAKSKLPPQLYYHECIKNIDTILLPQAISSLGELDFVPSSLLKIVQSLYIIAQLKDELPIHMDALYDTVFSSIGLRFSTVKNIVAKAGAQSNFVDSNQDKNGCVNTEAKDSSIEKNGKIPSAQSAQVDSTTVSKEDSSLANVGKEIGLTDDEIKRLSIARIHTIEEFVRADAVLLKSLFARRPFQSFHLLSVWRKMNAIK